MLCNELSNPRRGAARRDQQPARVDRSRYERLHQEGRRLISSWFNRAWDRRDAQGEDCFEVFVFAWMAVNGWAACITEIDTDSKFVELLMNDVALSTQFDALLAQPTSNFSEHVHAFAEFWPIFEVKNLRQNELLWHHEETRREYIDYCLAHKATRYQPQCWKRHTDAGEPVPRDWPHTIAALYRVRCNLFHGEKAPHSEMDQRIVSTSLRVLVHFFRESGYL